MRQAALSWEVPFLSLLGVMAAMCAFANCCTDTDVFATFRGLVGATAALPSAIAQRSRIVAIVEEPDGLPKPNKSLQWKTGAMTKKKTHVTTAITHLASDYGSR